MVHALQHERNRAIYTRYRAGESIIELAKEYNMTRQRAYQICKVEAERIAKSDTFPYKDLFNMGINNIWVIENICRSLQKNGIETKEDLAKLSSKELMNLEGANYKTRSFKYLNMLYVNVLKELSSTQ